MAMLMSRAHPDKGGMFGNVISRIAKDNLGILQIMKHKARRRLALRREDDWYNNGLNIES